MRTPTAVCGAARARDKKPRDEHHFELMVCGVREVQRHIAGKTVAGSIAHRLNEVPGPACYFADQASFSVTARLNTGISAV